MPWLGKGALFHGRRAALRRPGPPNFLGRRSLPCPSSLKTRGQGYFDNLPVYLQESIRQSGIPIDTEARLCRLVQELTQERGNF